MASLWPALLVAAIILPSAEWTRVLPGVRADARQCSAPSAQAADRVGADYRRLRNDLLCDYDRLVIKPGTAVEVAMFIYRLHLDVHRGYLQMLADVEWKWHDPRLQWDPTAYSDVSQIIMTEKEIWIPDLEALSAMQRDFDVLRCVVLAAGNVTCDPVFNLETTCGHSARRWPMDDHECVFEIASRNHDGREYIIVVDQNETELRVSPMVSTEWEVVNATQAYRDTVISESFHFSRIEFRLVLKRNNMVHIVTIGVPLLVMPALILAQLWVDPRWPGRLLLGCSSIGALCMYLQYLGFNVPSDTDGRAPLIVLFYRNCLVAAVFVVILTVVLRGVSECRGAPPPWLTNGSSWLLQRVPGPVAAGMLLEDEDDDEDDDAVDAAQEASAPEHRGADAVGKPISWRRIARIVDRAVFVVLLIVFVVLAFAEA